MQRTYDYLRNVSSHFFNIWGKFLFIAFCIIYIGFSPVYRSYKVFSYNLYRYFTQQCRLHKNSCVLSIPLDLFLLICSSSSVPLHRFQFIFPSSAVPLFPILFTCSSLSIPLQPFYSFFFGPSSSAILSHQFLFIYSSSSIPIHPFPFINYSSYLPLYLFPIIHSIHITDGFTTYKWLLATTFMLQELHKELY